MKSILGYKFEFNEHTSGNYSSTKPYDELLLKTTNNYCNDVLRTVGYISLETILKTLGMNKIDPDELDETKVYRFNGHYLHFDYHWESDSMIVTICENYGI